MYGYFCVGDLLWPTIRLAITTCCPLFALFVQILRCRVCSGELAKKRKGASKERDYSNSCHGIVYWVKDAARLLVCHIHIAKWVVVRGLWWLKCHWWWWIVNRDARRSNLKLKAQIFSRLYPALGSAWIFVSLRRISINLHGEIKIICYFSDRTFHSLFNHCTHHHESLGALACMHIYLHTLVSSRIISGIQSDLLLVINKMPKELNWCKVLDDSLHRYCTLPCSLYGRRKNSFAI